MTSPWIAKDTTAHQDHVIAHVIGAKVLGFFIFDEALHLLLDMEFIWTIYVDGEMGLLQQGLAISELEIDGETRQELLADVDLLQHQGVELPQPSRMRLPPADCRITEVGFFSCGDNRRLVLTGEAASLAIETSLTTAEIQIYEYR
jgi:hypothetical protein